MQRSYQRMRWKVLFLLNSTYTYAVRIAYCTNVRLPNERAHGHQIGKVIDSLLEMGHEVEVFCPYRKNPIEASLEAYYRLPRPVPVRRLGTIDWIRLPFLPGVLKLWLLNFFFGWKLRMILRRRKKEFDVVYTRTPEILSALTGAKIPLIVELHKIPEFRQGRFLRILRKARLVVALTSYMRQTLVDLGVASVPVIAEGDAVDLHDFEGLPSSEETRSSLGIPEGVPLIVYAGQLLSMGLSKGIPELLGALEILKNRGLGFQAVIAGGPENVKEEFVKELPDALRDSVQFPGHLPHMKIPTLLAAADVLVYPAPESDHPFYIRDTSPLKVFEYMAAGRPIVTADLPPIHDVLQTTMATFVPAGNIEALADGIRAVLDDFESASKRALLARKHVEQFTWEKRMERILSAARINK